MASDRMLICNVEYGDSLYYSYDSPYAGDTLSVFVAHDTVYINYKGNTPKKLFDQDPAPLRIKLRLPQVSNFIVENGRVNILSVDTTRVQTVSAEVNGGGVFNIGGPAISGGDGQNKEKNRKMHLRLDQLKFIANNGRLELTDSVKLRSLQLQVSGTSMIQINYGVQVNEISGAVSDSTTINGTWDVIKKIKN
jgi:hypothetical protein